MVVKDRLLVLLQILRENTDEEKSMTTAEILAEMEKRGLEGCKRTLRSNIRSLQECGYEIAVNEKKGKPTTYAFQSQWPVPELQVLVDAVASAQFIPQVRSGELIARLSRMAGPSHREKMVPRFLVSERVKTKNTEMIFSVQAIHEAIEKNRKIAIVYQKYDYVYDDREKRKKLKLDKKYKEGSELEKHVVSPYATVWNNDRYYLVGWSDKRNDVNVFRIDRMKTPEVLKKEERVPEPEWFDIRDYTDKVFWMYPGPGETVTLRCSMEILDQVVDRFGDEIRLYDVRDGRFSISVPVKLSTTFYAWVFQFIGQMRITAPEYVQDAYIRYLEQAIDETLGE